MMCCFNSGSRCDILIVTPGLSCVGCWAKCTNKADLGKRYEDMLRAAENQPDARSELKRQFNKYNKRLE